MSVQASDDVYLAHRDALFGLAYRMLGSAADAEDVVAETYLRWRRIDHDMVADDRAYLFSIAARLSLDLLKSAQRSRVDYVGTWLPEPLVTSYDDPAVRAETKDTISLAFLLMLEQLTPPERAVFVLRTAFDYRHAEIAQLLEMSVDNVRQLFRRSQQRLGAGAQARFVPDPVKQRAIVDRFLAAAATGEVEPLAQLLAGDAALYADGGGKAASIRDPAFGAVRIARFLRGLVRQSPSDLRVDVVRANGAPALLLRTTHAVVGVYALDVDTDAGVIRAIHAVRNPDKLTRLSA
jgi:RNA polymerase sigma-70 factor (ECF subfamily)